MAPRPATRSASRATSAIIDVSGVPNDALTDFLSEVDSSSRAKAPTYEWAPDSVLCSVYYEVLVSTLGFALPLDAPFATLETFCSAVAGAHSECTAAQYGRGLLRVFQYVEPYEAITGRTVSLLPLSLEFAIFYVAKRFKECTANGDSIRKEFAGLLFLHTQLGFDCCVATPLFDSAFAGYSRGITSLSDVVGRRGLHPSSVALVVELMLAPDAGPVVVETGALILFAYLFWFRPVSVVALSLEHVKILPGNILEVVEVARKATGASASQRAVSRTKIVDRQFPFVPASRLGTALILFLELAMSRVSTAQSRLFTFSTESGMTAAIQRLMSAILLLQPEMGVPEEYTLYSGRIGGLTASKILGASPERVNVWGGWVQGGTSWAPYLRPNILFSEVPADLAFAMCCFDHLLPPKV